VASRQDLCDCERDQLGAADRRASARTAPGGQEGVHQHGKCGERVVEVGAREATSGVDVAVATPTVDGLSFPPGPAIVAATNSESVIGPPDARAGRPRARDRQPRRDRVHPPAARAGRPGEAPICRGRHQRIGRLLRPASRHEVGVARKGQRGTAAESRPRPHPLRPAPRWGPGPGGEAWVGARQVLRRTPPD